MCQNRAQLSGKTLGPAGPLVLKFSQQQRDFEQSVKKYVESSSAVKKNSLASHIGDPRTRNVELWLIYMYCNDS